MSYLVKTNISKAKVDFIDILDFETQIGQERHAAVGSLLLDAEALGDLLTSSGVFVEEGINFKAVISSDWVDQATYETYFNDAVSQEEITRIEAAGYVVTRDLP